MGLSLLLVWCCFVPLAIMFVCIVIDDVRKMKDMEEQYFYNEVEVVKEDYRLITSDETMILNVSQPLSLVDVLKLLITTLKQYNALSCLDLIFFEETHNPFKKETVVKRAKVYITFPYTVFTIKKLSKGSINKEEFMAVLKYIKEKYNERI